MEGRTVAIEHLTTKKKKKRKKEIENRNALCGTERSSIDPHWAMIYRQSLIGEGRVKGEQGNLYQQS
jgi:hypothetical protein